MINNNKFAVNLISTTTYISQSVVQIYQGYCKPSMKPYLLFQQTTLIMKTNILQEEELILADSISLRFLFISCIKIIPHR